MDQAAPILLIARDPDRASALMTALASLALDVRQVAQPADAPADNQYPFGAHVVRTFVCAMPGAWRMAAKRNAAARSGEAIIAVSP